MADHYDQREALHDHEQREEPRESNRMFAKPVRDISTVSFEVYCVGGVWMAYATAMGRGAREPIGEGSTPVAAMIQAEGHVRGWR